MSKRRVLIAGGGVAGLEAMLTLNELASELVDVELVAPEPRSYYRPVAVAEPFGLGTVRSFELAELAARAGARFTPGELVAVEADAHIAHTATGAFEYDSLLLACGAAPRAVVPGALTFRGPADTEVIRGLLREIDAGEVARVAVVAPLGMFWTLPAYELALLIAGYADVEVALVTPEDKPLLLFGSAARDALEQMLTSRQITVHSSRCPIEFREGELHVAPGAPIAADRVVALPRLYGRFIDGVPQTRAGFVVVDHNGRVGGLPDVFAAGDLTTFPVKQGGIAAQQADAAAEAIAADAGAEVLPQPFRPVLRGLLLTGGVPRYLRRDVARGNAGTVSVDPLWWPPAKIVGRRLTPFLAGVVERPTDAIEIDVSLEPDLLSRLQIGLGF
jgi:sulfide:quinone oxidoreductase